MKSNAKLKLFGDNYVNRVDIWKHLYIRVIFIRAWALDIPLAICISLWVIPWEALHDIAIVREFVAFMGSQVPDIQKHGVYSNYPEFSMTFLSFTHAIGIASLILPVRYSVSSKLVDGHLKKKGIGLAIKMFAFSLLWTVVIVTVHLSEGAISYLGCTECSYHSKLSLIAGGIIPWALIHYALIGGGLFIRSAVRLRQQGEL